MCDFFVHSTAIAETEDIGSNTKIWAFSHVMNGAKIGSNCNIGDHCYVENGAVVADNVTIKNGNMLFEGITLEEGVFVGPHVFFTNDPYPRSPRMPQAKKRYEDKGWFRPTLIRRGASLGAASVIVAGVVVGEFAMVGAGAVVTKDVPDYALVIGNPAKQVGWVCQCGIKLSIQENHARCEDCGLEYRVDGKKMMYISR